MLSIRDHAEIIRGSIFKFIFEFGLFYGSLWVVKNDRDSQNTAPETASHFYMQNGIILSIFLGKYHNYGNKPLT